MDLPNMQRPGLDPQQSESNLHSSWSSNQHLRDWQVIYCLFSQAHRRFLGLNLRRERDLRPLPWWATQAAVRPGSKPQGHRAHLESAPAARPTQHRPVAARFLDWWHESSHLFYLKEKQEKEVSVMRSIAPEWKTGFLKQIQDNKEFHKINLTNSFFCRLSNFKKLYQAIFIFEPEWNTVVFKMRDKEGHFKDVTKMSKTWTHKNELNMAFNQKVQIHGEKKPDLSKSAWNTSYWTQY